MLIELFIVVLFWQEPSCLFSYLPTDIYSITTERYNLFIVCERFLNKFKLLRMFTGDFLGTCLRYIGTFFLTKNAQDILSNLCSKSFLVFHSVLHKDSPNVDEHCYLGLNCVQVYVICL